MSLTPPSSKEYRRAIDPKVSLPNEDLRSSFRDDAVHWLAVYGELIDMKEALLTRAEEVLLRASADTVVEATFDLRLLQTQAARYRIRRTLWVHRAEELLAAGYLPPPSEDIA